MWEVVRGFWSSNTYVRRNKNSKVLVFGDSGVGKTTLLAYWARDGMGRPRSWMADTVSANERGFTLRIIHHEEGRALTYLEEKDCATKLSEVMLMGAHTCIVLFSLVDRKSFSEAKNRFIPEIIALKGSHCPIILVGTKLDLREKEEKEKKRKREEKGGEKGGKKEKKEKGEKGEKEEKEKKEKEKKEEKEEKGKAEEGEMEGGVIGTTINDLPSEVLMRIFDFLETSDLVHAMQVNKRWNEIGKYPYVWKDRSKGFISTEEGVALKNSHPEVTFYMEMSLDKKTRVKNPKVSKQLVRKVAVSAAVSGPPPPKPAEFEEFGD